MLRLSVLLAAIVVGACAPTTPGATGAPVSAPAPPASPAASPAAVGSALPPATERLSPTPVPGAPCPDVEMPSLFEFTEADPTCFRGDIFLTGWLSGPPALGFEGPAVEPAWLYYPTDSALVLWSVIPVGEDPGCPEPSPQPCAWIFLHVNPDSRIDIGKPGRWMTVIGHIHDPAAPTCHYTYPDDADENPWGSPPDAEAQTQCDANFVVTRVGDPTD